jgi:hypothetical protein
MLILQTEIEKLSSRLRTLIISSEVALTTLPSEIGLLRTLEILDLRGTTLPVAELAGLVCLLACF